LFCVRGGKENTRVCPGGEKIPILSRGFTENFLPLSSLFNGIALSKTAPFYPSPDIERRSLPHKVLADWLNQKVVPTLQHFLCIWLQFFGGSPGMHCVWYINEDRYNPSICNYAYNRPYTFNYFAWGLPYYITSLVLERARITP